MRKVVATQGILPRRTFGRRHHRKALHQECPASDALIALSQRRDRPNDGLSYDRADFALLCGGGERKTAGRWNLAYALAHRRPRSWRVSNARIVGWTLCMRRISLG